jgi:hypothetical protein
MAKSLDSLYQVARELLCKGQHGIATEHTEYKEKYYVQKFYISDGKNKKICSQNMKLKDVLTDNKNFKSIFELFYKNFDKACRLCRPYYTTCNKKILKICLWV